MADQKISQLTEKQTLEANDLLVIATNNNNYKVKGSTVKTYAQNGLATVATSGDYTDLTNKPTIPTVNNATLTITQNGVSAGTFTANASSDATIAITETVQSASSPLSITSNVLSIATADTDTAGVLSASDWNTFNGKASAQAVVADTTSTTATLALASNTLYTFSEPLTALTISSIPSDTFETEIQFSSDTGFTFTASDLTDKWIGGTPTFEDSKSYVIVIKNGLGAWGEIS